MTASAPIAAMRPAAAAAPPAMIHIFSGTRRGRGRLRIGFGLRLRRLRGGRRARIRRFLGRRLAFRRIRAFAGGLARGRRAAVIGLVKTTALEYDADRMEDAHEHTAARRALRRPFVVESVFDLVRLAARLAAILVDWHRLRETSGQIAPAVSFAPTGAGTGRRCGNAMARTPSKRSPITIGSTTSSRIPFSRSSDSRRSARTRRRLNAASTIRPATPNTG